VQVSAHGRLRTFVSVRNAVVTLQAGSWQRTINGKERPKADCAKAWLM